MSNNIFEKINNDILNMQIKKSKLESNNNLIIIIIIIIILLLILSNNKKRGQNL
jgi:hypothetical protein